MSTLVGPRMRFAPVPSEARRKNYHSQHLLLLRDGKGMLHRYLVAIAPVAGPTPKSAYQYRADIFTYDAIGQVPDLPMHSDRKRRDTAAALQGAAAWIDARHQSPATRSPALSRVDEI